MNNNHFSITRAGMKARRAALEDLQEFYSQGLNSIEAEEASLSFQNLSNEEKDMVRIAFLNELQKDMPEAPEGFDGYSL